MEEVIKYLELKIDDLEVSIDNAKAYGSYATARKFVKDKIEFNAVIAFLKTCDGIKDITENGKLAIQRVSVSFLSEGMANKIYKQIGLLAEKQGGITGITILNQLPSWLQNFMKELAADYGRQIDFLKSVLANER